MRTKHLRRLVGLVAGAIVLASLATAGAAADPESARARLSNATGASVGMVKLTQGDGAVEVKAEVRGIAPGFHGFHVHAVGQCTPPFTSAGGHYNPTNTTHGAHAGDMPSLLVMDNGTAFLRFETDAFTVEELFDADGSAIIVHAGPDNFANIPTRYYSTTENVYGPDSATNATGDSGARIACGVVETG
jgi:superoxide dismutase, Cu-Zn family